MRKPVVISAISDELGRRDIEVSEDVVKLIVNLLLEIIIQETSRGVSISLGAFGTFLPNVKRYKETIYWGVVLRRGAGWRKRCLITRGATMDKYGVEIDKKDSKTKEAAARGLCPLCGSKLTGWPPVCPEHGSKPFERRPDGETEEG